MPSRKLSLEVVLLFRTWSTSKLSDRHCERLRRHVVNPGASVRGSGGGRGWHVAMVPPGTVSYTHLRAHETGAYR
eukprot:9442876-Pyramimonas_sp.AAC.1